MSSSTSMRAKGFLEVELATGRTAEVQAGFQWRLRSGDGGAESSAQFSFLNLSIGSALSAFFRRLFVPTGRVSPEYGRFQLVDSVQATCSYLRGILSVHATLTGAGIGAAAAAAAASSDGTASSTAGAAAIAALAAVVTLVLKDGCGMIGSLLFSYLFSHRFDAELRFWRLFADIINDIGLTVELLAPLTGPQLFVPVTCAANVCKALCGVAAGATRVSLAKHFALDGASVAEVQAKEGAQETAVTLLGLCLGLMCSSYLNSSLAVQWTAFIALTLLHVAANYYGVRILRLRTMNRTRLGMLAGLYAAGAAAGSSKDGTGGEAIDTSFSSSSSGSGSITSVTPAAIADMEPVLPAQYARRCADSFCMGSVSFLSLVCCSPRFESRRRGRASTTLPLTPKPTPTPLRQWLDVWQCEPCRIEVGVSAAQLMQLAAQAAAEDECASVDEDAAADAAMWRCIARVLLPAPAKGREASSSCFAYVAVLHASSSSSKRTARVSIALSPSATPKMVAAAYLGALAWADPACRIAGAPVPGESHTAASVCEDGSDGDGAGLVDSASVAVAGSNAAAALSIARSIAATVHAAPAFFSALAAAGWEVEDAGGFSLAEGGLRLSLLEQPAAVPSAAASLRSQLAHAAAAAAVETQLTAAGASAPPKASAGAGGADSASARNSLRKRRHSSSPTAVQGSK